MICRCFGKTLDIGAWANSARATAELIVGLPDYETYKTHLLKNHPGQPVMSQNEFFRCHQSTRFGAGAGLRCC